MALFIVCFNYPVLLLSGLLAHSKSRPLMYRVALNNKAGLTGNECGVVEKFHQIKYNEYQKKGVASNNLSFLILDDVDQGLYF